MRKQVLVLTISLFATLGWSAASALPGAPIQSRMLASGSASDVIEVKGGHGHGHGWGRGHGHRAYGWSRGRKVGWRGHGCPPGHWKKGWC
jgi:hypothetical protein